MDADRALIIDNEYHNMKKLSHSLKKMGFFVEAETDSHLALEKLHKGSNDFDLIFIEQGMPAVSGIDILKDIQSSNCKSCVIFMANNPDLKTIVSAMQEGAFSFIKKPIEHNQLEDLVYKGLENRRALFHILEMDSKLKKTNSELKKQSEKLRKEKLSLKRINQELNLLNQLSLQINSTLDAHKMVDTVAHSELNELIANDLVTFLYALGDELFLTIYPSFPSLSNETIEQIKSNSISAFMRHSGRKLNETDIQTKVIKRKIKHKSHVSKNCIADDDEIFIPLNVADNVLGMMGLVGVTKIDRNHLQLISTIANQVALALKNAAEHQKIQALAITDELTGLYNRRAFQRVLDREFRRSRRYQKPLSLIMLDVDGFKAINDTYGHQAGDSVLKALANQLQGAIREIDFLARYGGDEFAVILPETKAEEAGMLAERLKKIISNRPIIIGGTCHTISVSTGLADITNEIVESEQTLVNKADKVLYLSKAQAGHAAQAIGER